MILVIDNYDSFSDEGGSKSRKSFETMALLAREYGTAGLHFVAAGSLSGFSGIEDLRIVVCEGHRDLREPGKAHQPTTSIIY